MMAVDFYTEWVQSSKVSPDGKVEIDNLTFSISALPPGGTFLL